MYQSNSAHANSLHVYALIMRFEEACVEEASRCIMEGLAALGLLEHLTCVILFRNRRADISVEALSDFGDDILEEVHDRSSFPPCPEGTCEWDNFSTCKWCGMLQPQ